MAFHAKNFIFDEKPSEFYNIYLGEFNNDSSDIATPSSGDVSLLTQKLFRRPTPLFWGSEQLPVLSFPLALYSPDEISAPAFSEIGTWLFGQMEYKTLRICQNDLFDVFFNCFFAAPQSIRTGNIIRGLSCTVICDSPFGWKTPKYYDYTFTNQYLITDYVTFFNESADSAYTYPTELIITANIFGGSVTITNITDNSRQFILTLLPNEVVTLDCNHQFISSSLVTYPLYNFNLSWLRFLPGTNTLKIEGNVSEVEITSPVAVKIGP